MTTSRGPALSPRDGRAGRGSADASGSGAAYYLAPDGGRKAASEASSWRLHKSTPSSSSPAQTNSDQLTPDSDSEKDNGEHAGLHGGEAFELQERNQEEYRRPDDAAAGSDDEFRDDASDEDEHDSGTVVRHPVEPKWGRRRRRDSASTMASFQLYTPDEERAVVRKFDRKLVVFVALLYMLSFLDRSNIGNARVAGMDEDLQSSPPREDWYEWALTAFYIGYILFEWMSLLWKVVPAHIYVSILVLSWGIVASVQAVAVSYPMLIFLRTLLGIGEAGFSGIPYYLSFFFKRSELAFRTAIFISAAPLATTFASSLAWVILKVGEASPISSWRLLFLIEGFPSVFVAVLAWSVIPDSPQTAPYLSAREKKVARLRLRSESDDLQSEARVDAERHQRSATRPSKRGLNGREALSAFTDPITWLTAFMFFLTNMAYASLPVFLPTIIAAMGHDALSAQAMAAPPYFTAFLVVLASAHISDRMSSRSPFIITHALASAVGYGILALSNPLGVPAGSILRYLAVFPAAVGFFNVVVLVIAWSVNNQRSESSRGAGFALLQVVGQCGPLVGTRLYPDKDGPYYTSGMALCTGAMLGVAALARVLRWYLGRLNRKLDQAGKAGEQGTGEEEEGLVGDGPRRLSREFRYML